MKKINSRGQASAVDLGMFLIIIVMAIGFLQIYSVTHASTSVKNYGDQLMDEYAEHTLLSLSYLSPQGIEYETVQPQAVEYVYDEDLKAVLDASEKIRNYSRQTDNMLENWSKNISAAYAEMKKEIAGMKSNISFLRSDLSNKTITLTATLDSVNADCEEVVLGINSYGDLIGGTHISDDSCGFVEELGTTVSSTTSQADTLLSDAYNELSAAENNLDSDTDAVMQALTAARCLLRDLDVKNDYFISYAQTGIKENPNLLDLMPAKGKISSKTVTEAIGEALYIQDRLAESSIIGTAAAAGTRFALDETGGDSEDATNRILQGAVLSYGRKNYLELAENAVEKKLEVILSKQGYDYCFIARDCCTKISAGNCGAVPYNSAKATRSINTLDNQSANMTLDIWRK